MARVKATFATQFPRTLRLCLDLLRGVGIYNPDIIGNASAPWDARAKPWSDDANGALVSRE